MLRSGAEVLCSGVPGPAAEWPSDMQPAGAADRPVLAAAATLVATRVEVIADAADATAAAAEEDAAERCGGFRVLFRDAQVLVLAKPPGVLVHPVPKPHGRSAMKKAGRPAGGPAGALGEPEGGSTMACRLKQELGGQMPVHPIHRCAHRRLWAGGVWQWVGVC